MVIPGVEIKDSVLDPDSTVRIAQVRNPDDPKALYRVFLYLDGLRLYKVKAVTYVLHPSFKDQTRQVYRTADNPRCKLEIWTWGLFRVQGIVTDLDGNMITLSHDLQYNKQFSAPDVKFVAA